LFRRVLLIVLLISLLLSGVPAAGADDAAIEDLLLLEEMMGRLNQYHLDQPEPGQLMQGAINGMLGSMEDPYTEYFSPEELKEFANALDNDLFGIGVELRPGDYHPIVVRVIPSSPAKDAGIQAGDTIVAVDDASLKGLNFAEVVQIIRGPEGSKVKITVDRPGKGQKDFNVVRGHINIPTVDSSLLDDQTGYIYVGSFGSETANEFSSALGDLLAEDIKFLVLDLRNNGGGYLQAAVDMVSQFLSPGSAVVSIVDKDGNTDSYVTSGRPSATAVQTAIVVNESSASAAEVMAGAMRDHDRAVLVGTQTYGKGVMQTVIPLSNKGALKVTTHRYYTPSGTDLDGTGLIPDRRVLTPELQLVAAAQVLTGSNPLLEFALKDKIVRINNQEVEYMGPMPQMKSESLFIPLRFSLEALGYEVFFDLNCIRISGFGDTLEVYPDSGKLILNKDEKELKDPVKTVEGVRYISLEALKLLKLNINTTPDNVSITTR